MFKFIRNTALATWLAFNFVNIIRIIGCILAIFVIAFLHLRWEIYLLEFHPEKLLIMLILNSFIFFVILIWIFILTKKCVAPLNLNKALKAKKSVIMKPEKFEEILSVKLRPKLKRGE